MRTYVNSFTTSYNITIWYRMHRYIHQIKKIHLKTHIKLQQKLLRQLIKIQMSNIVLSLLFQYGYLFLLKRCKVGKIEAKSVKWRQSAQGILFQNLKSTKYKNCKLPIYLKKKLICFLNISEIIAGILNLKTLLLSIKYINFANIQPTLQPLQ